MLCLFTGYISPVASLIRSVIKSVHYYTDDTQLGCHFKPGKNELEVHDGPARCIEALWTWMHFNHSVTKRQNLIYLAVLKNVTPSPQNKFAVTT